MALFAVEFCTCGHGSDLVKLLAAQVVQLPSNEGLLVLNFQFTKTLRDGAAHAFLLEPDNDMPETCVIAARIYYVQVACSCGWDMSMSYLLPEKRASGDRTPTRLARPLFAKTMATHFKRHVEHAGLGARHFILYLFRVSCAVAQTIAGKEVADIMGLVTWKSEKIASRYVGGLNTTRDPLQTIHGAT